MLGTAIPFAEQLGAFDYLPRGREGPLRSGANPGPIRAVLQARRRLRHETSAFAREFPSSSYQWMSRRSRPRSIQPSWVVRKGLDWLRVSRPGARLGGLPSSPRSRGHAKPASRFLHRPDGLPSKNEHSLGQGLGIGEECVAQDLYDGGNGLDQRHAFSALAVEDGDRIDAKSIGRLSLRKLDFEPAPLDCRSN